MNKGVSTIIILSVLGLGVVLVALTVLLMQTNNAVVENKVQPKNPTATSTQSVNTVPSQPAEIKPVHLLFFGDIMLGRNVEAASKKNEAYPFEKTKDLIKAADLAVANLEGPIMTKHSPTPTGSTQFNFTVSTAQTIADAGFDVVSLANNHTLDFGQAGFDETRSWLKKAGIEAIGHPEKLHSDYVARKEVNGRNFVFVGFNAFPDLYTADKLEFTRKLAQQYDTILVVFMHWGDEYSLHSNKKQQDFAHKLIDSGADIVVGAHPHVVQEIELYRDKPIFYSFGNFIFDQYFSKDTQEELGVGIEINGTQAIYTLYPVQSIKSQPVQMQGAEKEKFLKALAERSDPALQEQIKAGVITEPFTTQ